jgi:carbon-monoxide dehydrogenase medium subunit
LFTLRERRVKPPSFDYHRPGTVAEALATLAELGDDAKVLAGGQSLVPLLNMRLAAPKALVDINRLGAELGAIEATADEVRVGALCRHGGLLRESAAAAVLPLLRQAAQCVAHETIRNRGTTVGSLVHADPAAEMPAVLLLCDGSMELASVSGTRTVPAAEFFIGPLESSLRSGELALSATFAVPPGRTGSAWVEVSRRAGDYALCGVGLTVTLAGDGTIAGSRAAYISVGPTPVLVDLTEAVGGAEVERADWAAAAALASERIEPEEDIHATADYRRHLVSVLTARAGRAAASHARERTAPEALSQNAQGRVRRD